jgi:hypothetical protein
MLTPQKGIRIPPKRIRERFIITYELEGCQKAVNFLTEYYGIRRMKIILNGKKVGKNNVALYYENKAYFTKRGLMKRTVLHEMYHHLVYQKGLGLSNGIEERQAVSYANEFLCSPEHSPKGMPNGHRREKWKLGESSLKALPCSVV